MLTLSFENIFKWILMQQEVHHVKDLNQSLLTSATAASLHQQPYTH